MINVLALQINSLFKENLFQAAIMYALKGWENVLNQTFFFEVEGIVKKEIYTKIFEVEGIEKRTGCRISGMPCRIFPDIRIFLAG